MAHPDSIERIMAIAHDLEITDIYAQVAVGGYAYYDSRVLPRSQYLARLSGPQYDPLASLIQRGKKDSIQIHAWVNTLLAWSLREPPDSLGHIYYTHPEWFIKDIKQRSMIDYSYEDWVNAGLEGLYLDPSVPEVGSFLQNLCLDIATRYPVAGIHLDFIRYPGVLWGMPANDTTALFAGIEGFSLRWLTLTRYAQLPFVSRWRVWLYWCIAVMKEKHIFEVVSQIRSALGEIIDSNHLVLSSALFPNRSLARYRFGQNWMEWDTIIDYPIIMSYTPDTYFFEDLVNFTLQYRSDAIFGIGILWPGMGATTYWQTSAVQENQGQGVCLFDFSTLDTIPDYQKVKGIGLTHDDSVWVDTLVYGIITMPFADMPSEEFTNQGTRLLDGDETAFAHFLLSLSLDQDQDLSRMNMTEHEFIQLIINDVAAFNYIGTQVFPIGDLLVEPPTREILYEYVPWENKDTTAVLTRARSFTTLSQHTRLYPDAMNILSQPVFDADTNEVHLHRTRSGIYVFKVAKTHEGGGSVLSTALEPPLLSVYKNWTIEQKLKELTSR
jgi:hypothetical protein